MGIARTIQSRNNPAVGLGSTAELAVKGPGLRPDHILEGLERIWEDGKSMGLLLFSLENIHAFRRAYGQYMVDLVAGILSDALKECSGSFLCDMELLVFERLDPHSYILVIHKEGLNLRGLADLAMTIRLSLCRSVNAELVKHTGQRMGIKAGYAGLKHQMGKNVSHCFYQSLCDAQEVAAGTLNMSKLRLMDEFRKIIEEPRLTVVYQPIVDLRSGSVLGWESLARGPADSRFQSPAVLFSFAEETGSLFGLERTCREQAIGGIGPLVPGQKLFLNIHPHTVGDPKFTAGETIRLLNDYGLSPEQVVFEITERHPIRDFTLFFHTIEHYRSQGYQVAIDDVGAGYSGLWTLGQLRPDFVKVDMSIVRGVDSNPVNRALVEVLVSFADKMGCSVIAEGIETETELSSLMDMGVHYGQGFFLAKPHHPKPTPASPLPVRKPALLTHFSGARCSVPIGELAEPAIQIAPEVKISDVQSLLENMPPTPISGVVITKDNKPLGLVMTHELNKHLGTLYGVALYYERPIVKLMDQTPLIFEESVPVEIVAERATSREKYKVYDHIIITRNGEMVGVVSVQKMLDSLAKAHVEMAKGANPLTGLPGNVAIEKEIEDRAKKGIGISLLYADLDNFKVYNDVYGFEAGDRMILLCAKVVKWASERQGNSDSYVGHVGGDDFVVIASPDKVERIAKAIVRVFKRLVPKLYTPDDAARGHIQGKSRGGKKRRFLLTSVSLAIVDCQGSYDLHLLAQRAAEVKKYAKSKAGNVYVRDRRSPVGILPVHQSAGGEESGRSDSPTDV